MFYITNDVLQNKEELNELIQRELAYVDSLILLQTKQQQTISNYMNVFFASPEYINIETVDELKKFSSEFKNNLEITNRNISELSDYKDEVKGLTTAANEDTVASINKKSSHVCQSVLFSISEIENSLQDFSNEFCKYNATKDTTNDDCENESIRFINQKNTTSSTTNVNTSKSSFNTSIPENTLVISEKSNLVYLPYNSEDLQKLMDQYPNASVDSIINKYYTRKAKDYKNPPIARFKEAYKLVRNKEKMSIVEASNLGLELCFKTNLHPAIISACRSINELDEYLGYLENNHTEKFDRFHIQFEMAPTLYKK